jgi:hypothetical protein
MSNQDPDAATLATRSVAQAAAESAGEPGTHNDPVTGEPISKSELKRREKARQKEKSKAEKVGHYLIVGRRLRFPD